MLPLKIGDIIVDGGNNYALVYSINNQEVTVLWLLATPLKHSIARDIFNSWLKLRRVTKL